MYSMDTLSPAGLTPLRGFFYCAREALFSFLSDFIYMVDRLYLANNKV